MSAARLSEWQKTDLLNAYLRGEKVKVIAMIYGVDESYPGLLAKRRNIPLRWSEEKRANWSQKCRARRRA